MKKFFYFVSFVTLIGCGAAQGPQGEPGINGARGQKGDQGPQGIQGLTGQTGQKGKDGQSYEDLVKDMSALMNSYKPAFLHVVCYLQNSNIIIGSGSKLSNGMVLTAFHVISDSSIDDVDHCNFYSAQNQDYVGYINTSNGVAYSVQGPGGLDIAYIQPYWNIEGLNITGVPFVKNYIPQVGDFLTLASFQYGMVNVEITFGNVSSSSLAGDLSSNLTNYWANSFSAALYATAGSSGGPIFDLNGNVVAILVGGFNPNINLDLNIGLPVR